MLSPSSSVLVGNHRSLKAWNQRPGWMMSSVDQRRAWETLWTYDSGDLLEVRQGGGGFSTLIPVGRTVKKSNKVTVSSQPLKVLFHEVNGFCMSKISKRLQRICDKAQGGLEEWLAVMHMSWVNVSAKLVRDKIWMTRSDKPEVAKQ